MAKDFLMNACGDMDITGGDARLVSGADQVRQSWIIHMSTYLGEWFLDQAKGIPYIQEIFSKIISRATLKKIFRDESLNVVGVIRVTNVVVGDIDPATRSIDVSVYADIEGEENALLTYTGVIPSAGCENTGSAEYPATLGDLVMWFDAQDSSSYAASASSIVVQNKAGTGTATGTGTASVPTLAPGINGNAAFLLDNSDDQYFDIADTPAVLFTAPTIFIVIKPDETVSSPDSLGALALAGIEGGVQQTYNFDVYGGDLVARATAFEVGQTEEPVTADTGENPTDACVLTFKITDEGDQWDVSINYNGDYVDDSSWSTDVLAQLNGDGLIGATLDYTTATTPENFFSGYIGEILVYNEELSSETIGDVEDYLADKWSITGS